MSDVFIYDIDMQVLFEPLTYPSLSIYR